MTPAEARETMTYYADRIVVVRAELRATPWYLLSRRRALRRRLRTLDSARRIAKNVLFVYLYGRDAA